MDKTLKVALEILRDAVDNTPEHDNGGYCGRCEEALVPIAESAGIYYDCVNSDCWGVRAKALLVLVNAELVRMEETEEKV